MGPHDVERREDTILAAESAPHQLAVVVACISGHPILGERRATTMVHPCPSRNLLHRSVAEGLGVRYENSHGSSRMEPPERDARAIIAALKSTFVSFAKDQ